jgi:hypothetical protein
MGFYFVLGYVGVDSEVREEGQSNLKLRIFVLYSQEFLFLYFILVKISSLTNQVFIECSAVMEDTN